MNPDQAWKYHLFVHGLGPEPKRRKTDAEIKQENNLAFIEACRRQDWVEAWRTTRHADPDYRDPYSWDTALHIIARTDSDDPRLSNVIEDLLELGFDPHLQNRHGESPLDLAFEVNR